MSNCYTCAYRANIPGNCHISCKFNWLKSELKPPQANPHGITKGWYFFPANFDPMWQITECEGYSTILDEKMCRSEYEGFEILKRFLGF